MESGGKQGTQVGAKTEIYRIVVGGELSGRYATTQVLYFRRFRRRTL
jgi:hypothetical protein